MCICRKLCSEVKKKKRLGAKFKIAVPDQWKNGHISPDPADRLGISLICWHEHRSAHLTEIMKYSSRLLQNNRLVMQLYHMSHLVEVTFKQWSETWVCLVDVPVALTPLSSCLLLTPFAHLRQEGCEKRRQGKEIQDEQTE